MAPDKFEKYIKEKMRQREITPSEEAWSKIAGQLPEEEEKRKKPIVWYSIAASFVGILILSVYMMQSPKPELDSPVQIVSTEEKTSDENKTASEEPEIIQATEGKQVDMLAETPSQQEIRNEVKDVVREAVSPSPEQELASTEKPNAVEIQKKEELLIQAKITEVVAEVRLLELNNEALTEAEVDSLLMKAQSEILKEKILKADRSVDALALLNEVEGELDRSFRDQIFDRLKAGFNKVRTAVADRNN